MELKCMFLYPICKGYKESLIASCMQEQLPLQGKHEKMTGVYE